MYLLRKRKNRRHISRHQRRHTGLLAGGVTFAAVTALLAVVHFQRIRQTAEDMEYDVRAIAPKVADGISDPTTSNKTKLASSPDKNPRLKHKARFTPTPAPVLTGDGIPAPQEGKDGDVSFGR